ncbi:MD-2-related lipid-recognition protein-like [Topomyia yanbarensis]|uniref:MD-2-related lipid-recognition protein-like n=1 Tax=Topomyia yanbarensis TaxID=2498891 RepID=UPI00273B7555|nr:MD-2-related lipid-recognition protein-like [Topomyia yanbarensis]
MKRCVGILVVICLVAIARGEIVNFAKCNESVKCTIHEVRVNPCPEAAHNKPCLLLKGTNATITYDYTPDFSAKKATAKAFWTQTAMDLPFAGMDSEGCKYTSCPIVEAQRQTYSYNLPIHKKYPSRAFDVKWELINEDQEMCCFIIQIAIKAKRDRN